ncbi:MAG TPA: hypothetical protein VFW50_28065 [Streptosporangiaceae bacterium]|nr:hypothetical protein [Streptosporangiaceae bacterium]
MKTLPTYEIRIAGRVDEATLTSFAGLAVRLRDDDTIVTGQFDQAALHGMLEMIRSLGLDLLEARRVDAAPPRDDPGAADRGLPGAARPDDGRRRR